MGCITSAFSLGASSSSRSDREGSKAHTAPGLQIRPRRLGVVGRFRVNLRREFVPSLATSEQQETNLTSLHSGRLISAVLVATLALSGCAKSPRPDPTGSGPPIPAE